MKRVKIYHFKVRFGTKSIIHIVQHKKITLARPSLWASLCFILYVDHFYPHYMQLFFTVHKSAVNLSRLNETENHSSCTELVFSYNNAGEIMTWLFTKWMCQSGSFIFSLYIKKCHSVHWFKKKRRTGNKEVATTSKCVFSQWYNMLAQENEAQKILINKNIFHRDRCENSSVICFA